MKKTFSMVGIIIAILISFWLFVGFMKNWGQPYLKRANQEISIGKDAWPNIFGEEFIYTINISKQEEELFLSKNFRDILQNSIFYVRPIGDRIDYIRIEKNGIKVIFTPRHRKTNPEIFIEADKKFGLIKKEINAEKLLMDFIKK